VPPANVKILKKGTMVDLGDGIRGPGELLVSVRLPEHPNVGLTVWITLLDGVYQVTSLQLDPRKRGGFTTEFLRSIPLQSIVRATAGAELRRLNRNKSAYTDNATIQEPEGELLHTAFTYRLARLLGDAPTKAVMEALGVSRSTASRKVAEARKAGYLRVDETGQSGGAPSRLGV
jgi:hypothetical protein